MALQIKDNNHKYFNQLKIVQITVTGYNFITCSCEAIEGMVLYL